MMRLLLLLLCFLSIAHAKDNNLTIPIGKGLPVIVRTALYYNNVSTFNDNQETFEATTDLRLIWEDPRLRYTEPEGLHDYKEFRASRAEEEIAKMWTPTIYFANRVGEPTFSERRLRLYANGKVELMTRTTAIYKTPIDSTRFPFDHQRLDIHIVVREDTLENVVLDFLSDDMEFSRVSKNMKLKDWTLGLVNLQRQVIHGWNGDYYAQVIASLNVKRQGGNTVTTIFIPLFASLLIPFLATWMNKIENGEFKIEAYDLANFIIGGLFAIIALSFTINASYPIIASNDNTVTRLIALNYVALTVGLIIILVFFRYNLLKKCFGSTVQEQAFIFIKWAFPVVFILTGLAFLLVAAA